MHHALGCGSELDIFSRGHTIDIFELDMYTILTNSSISTIAPTLQFVDELPQVSSSTARLPWPLFQKGNKDDS
eukprot:scaffold165921_cov49-Prasinocladus_malaysianus.AAC.1